MTNLVTAIDDYVRPLTNNPILGQVIIKGVDITTASQNIAHGLGRAWQGWWVVSKDANINVWESAAQAPSNLYITLQASGTGTVDIYIF